MSTAESAEGFFGAMVPGEGPPPFVLEEVRPDDVRPEIPVLPLALEIPELEPSDPAAPPPLVLTRRQRWAAARLARGYRPTHVAEALCDAYGLSPRQAWRDIGAVKALWAREVPATRADARAEVLAELNDALMEARSQGDPGTVTRLLSLKADITGLKVRAVAVSVQEGGASDLGSLLGSVLAAPLPASLVEPTDDRSEDPAGTVPDTGTFALPPPDPGPVD